MTARKTLAERIANRAVAIAPPSRREWLLAMRSELSHLPERRLGFALGALWVAFTERSIAMKNIAIRPIEACIVLSAAFLALVATANGIRLYPTDPAVAVSMWGLSLVWAGVLVATLLELSRLLLRMAFAGLAMAVAIGLATLLPTPAFAANAAMLRALSLEAVILFSVLLVAAVVARNRLDYAA